MYDSKLHVCNMIAKELTSFLLLICMHAEYVQGYAIVLQPSLRALHACNCQQYTNCMQKFYRGSIDIKHVHVHVKQENTFRWLQCKY